VAEQYGVELWSEKHWKLMEKSFELIAQVGGKSIYLPLVRRTHFGNEHSMVRWIEKGGGKYDHDFSIVERYVDLAVKHLGKDIPLVCLYVWETKSSKGSSRTRAKVDREILFSILDPATKKLKEAVGPKWGTPECAEFWKPVMAGIRERLAKHGLEKSMMLGLAGDWTPTKEAVGTLRAAAPGAKWVRHQHSFGPNITGQPAGYVASVWGLMSPGYKRPTPFGWRNPILVARFARNDLSVGRPPAQYRIYAGRLLSVRGKYRTFSPDGFRGGPGRVGADFWPALKDKRGRSRYLVARYPESEWGQLRLTYAIPYLFSPGRDGAISSVRFEAVRENVQESEARALLEDAVSRDEIKAKVGEDLAARALELLYERERAAKRVNYAGGSIWYGSSGWRERSAALYRLAGEAAGKLGTR